MDDARARWLAHTAGTRAAGRRAEVELAGRHVDDAEPEQRVTAAEWLDAHREAVVEDDCHRDITEIDVVEVDDPCAEESAAAEGHAAPAADEVVELPERDIREVTATEPPPVGEDVVRVPSADETADALSGASRALAEIRAREVAEQQEETEHRATELTRWHAIDQAAGEAIDADEHVDEMGDHDPAPVGAP